MLKMKVTNKMIKNSYKEVYSVGYCELSYLFRCLEPKYYTCGVYGWNADIFEYDNNCVIQMGYRASGECINYKFVREYNEKAREIWNNFTLEYEEQKKQCKALLDEFISTIRQVAKR